MITFLSLFLHVLISPTKTQARLEPEIVLLLHQLNVLRQDVASSQIYDGRSTALRLVPCSRAKSRLEYHSSKSDVAASK